MRSTDIFPQGDPAEPARARNEARWLGVLPAGFAAINLRWRKVVALVVLFILASMLTYQGFFLPGVPLWFAGVPLLAAILTGRRAHRAIAFAAFSLWPAILCAAGLAGLAGLADLAGLGYHPAIVWPVAAMIVIVLAALCTLIGVAALTISLTLIVTFPASPILVLADAMPRTGLLAPILVMAGLAIVEFLPANRAVDIRKRAAVMLMIAVGVLAAPVAPVAPVWSVTATSYSGQLPSWRALDTPRAISERGRWIALRNSLPRGAKAIFGENVFGADDNDAIAFWCDAARQRNLTLWIGVRGEDVYNRGQVWHFDPNCTPLDGPTIVHAARYGIPHITGTWGRMEPLRPDQNAGTDQIAGTDPKTAGEPAGDAGIGPSADSGPEGPASAWLICYEAFLVWPWMETLAQLTDIDPTNSRPIIILSNDGAFGALPLGRLHHKVAHAMARLAGRTVLHAQTGKTFLINIQSAR